MCAQETTYQSPLAPFSGSCERPMASNSSIAPSASHVCTYSLAQLYTLLVSLYILPRTSSSLQLKIANPVPGLMTNTQYPYCGLQQEGMKE